MGASLLLIFSLIAALAAMVCLSLAMEKHYQSMFESQLSVAKIRMLKLTGWLLLVASLGLCVELWGGVIGSVAWVGELTVGYVAVVLLLAWPVGFSRKS
ncbi:DUF3325 domain-containing protein [Rheinheimera texasensis]|uniref:DUF3325 domain-containing protein n=1 Tax=Rheinheimera texasensis TaxID=306205 RepID=UPI000691E582|nr:DUF3325 domain-containing protein [Rheinheimera texasensis]